MFSMWLVYVHIICEDNYLRKKYNVNGILLIILTWIQLYGTKNRVPNFTISSHVETKIIITYNSCIQHKYLVSTYYDYSYGNSTTALWSFHHSEPFNSVCSRVVCDSLPIILEIPKFWCTCFLGVDVHFVSSPVPYIVIWIILLASVISTNMLLWQCSNPKATTCLTLTCFLTNLPAIPGDVHVYQCMVYPALVIFILFFAVNIPEVFWKVRRLFIKNWMQMFTACMLLSNFLKYICFAGLDCGFIQHYYWMFDRIWIINEVSTFHVWQDGDSLYS